MAGQDCIRGYKNAQKTRLHCGAPTLSRQSQNTTSRVRPSPLFLGSICLLQSWIADVACRQWLEGPPFSCGKGWSSLGLGGTDHFTLQHHTEKCVFPHRHIVWC